MHPETSSRNPTGSRKRKRTHNINATHFGNNTHTKSEIRYISIFNKTLFRMDVSVRLERLRNRTIATWNNTKPSYKQEQTNEKSNQLRLCRILGDLPFFIN